MTTTAATPINIDLARRKAVANLFLAREHLSVAALEKKSAVQLMDRVLVMAHIDGQIGALEKLLQAVEGGLSQSGVDRIADEAARMWIMGKVNGAHDVIKDAHCEGIADALDVFRSPFPGPGERFQRTVDTLSEPPAKEAPQQEV